MHDDVTIEYIYLHLFADTSLDEPVKGMSNYHRPITGFVERRESGHSGKLSRVCPIQFVEYNPSMAGTDSFGRRRLRFSTRHISKKWWRGLYYFVLDTSLVNGYVVYMFFFKRSGDTGKLMKFAEFIQCVYEEGFRQLGYKVNANATKSKYGKHAEVNDEDELIDLSGAASDTKCCTGVDPCLLADVGTYTTRYTNCVWCYGLNPHTPDKFRHHTKYYCRGCGTPLGLECFKPWHMLLERNV